MKTITINAYEVNELSPKAFGNAHQEWLQQFDWYDYDCYFDDIKRLLIIFDLGILDYSLNVDYAHHSYVKYWFDSDDAITKIDGIRLWKLLQNQFPSLCEDMSDSMNVSYYLKPLAEFLAKPSKYTTIYDIINDCLSIIFKSIVADYEYQCGEDNFIELCSIQEMLFDEDGKRIL